MEAPDPINYWIPQSDGATGSLTIAMESIVDETHTATGSHRATGSYGAHPAT